MIPDTKRCRRCDTEKPAAAFPRVARMADGLSSWCTDCKNARTREWRAEKRERINAARREHYAAEVAARNAKLAESEAEAAAKRRKLGLR